MRVNSLLNAKYVRDNLEVIRDSIKRRQKDFPLDKLLKIDEDWRTLKTKTQELQAQVNKASIDISNIKKSKSGENIDEKVKELGVIKKQIETNEKKLSEYQTELDKLLWNVPNIAHEKVPLGKDDTENPVLRTWGEKRSEI